LISLALHGLQAHSPLWMRASPLHHLYLLSTPAAAALGSSQKYFCPDSWRGARPFRLFPSGLRRYAGAHSPAHRRAGQGNPFHCDSGLETARLTPFAAQEAGTCRTIASGICVWGRFAATLLAAPLLRFQRLGSEEEGRKAPLHAQESAETKTGRSPQALALEQIFLLMIFGKDEQDDLTGEQKKRLAKAVRELKEAK